mmetsp:Transcript_6734/g.24915  ORF Transcript_6734/g.24915 Transcript_6734/m.24915 type:complete len:209 (+) Transcript_6734:160-786(+)
MLSLSPPETLATEPPTLLLSFAFVASPLRFDPRLRYSSPLGKPHFVCLHMSADALPRATTEFPVRLYLGPPRPPPFYLRPLSAGLPWNLVHGEVDSLHPQRCWSAPSPFLPLLVPWLQLPLLAAEPPGFPSWPEPLFLPPPLPLPLPPDTFAFQRPFSRWPYVLRASTLELDLEGPSLPSQPPELGPGVRLLLPPQRRDPPAAWPLQH